MLKTTDRKRLRYLYSTFSKLDLERIRFMKLTEAMCKQRKSKAYEWSPTLVKMGESMLLEIEGKNDQRHIHSRYYRATKRAGNT